MSEEEESPQISKKRIKVILFMIMVQDASILINPLYCSLTSFVKVSKYVISEEGEEEAPKSPVRRSSPRLSPRREFGKPDQTAISKLDALTNGDQTKIHEVLRNFRFFVILCHT